MAWIESHQALRNHPKTKKAARLAGISKRDLIGAIHFLWWWALDYAQDGDLTGYDAAELEDEMEWEGAPGKLFDALLHCGKDGGPGFIERTADGRTLLHDWWEYAGKLIDKRQKDAERKRSERAKPVRGTSNGHPADGAGTQPNPTQPTQPTQPVGLEPCLSLIAWTNTRYLKELGPGDGELVSGWVELYGDEPTRDVIEYCDVHKKSKTLKASYVEETLRGRQMDGTLYGRSNGNGHVAATLEDQPLPMTPPGA